MPLRRPGSHDVRATQILLSTSASHLLSAQQQVYHAFHDLPRQGYDRLAPYHAHLASARRRMRPPCAPSTPPRLLGSIGQVSPLQNFRLRQDANLECLTVEGLFPILRSAPSGQALPDYRFIPELAGLVPMLALQPLRQVLLGDPVLRELVRIAIALAVS